jgi:endonuclease YncB( thermonuclease family)
MRMRRALAGLATVVLATTGLALTPVASAGASEAIQELALVTRHVDGDTVAIHLEGNDAELKVRLIGIQAPEIASATGVVQVDQCGARAAKDLLDSLLPVGTEVALRSLSASSTNNGRLFRSVFTRGTDGYNDENEGEWGVDVSRVMMASGLALWFPGWTETAHNREYEIIAERADANKTGLWHPGYCGPGPAASLAMYVNWDAPGDDSKNINGEWFLIRNQGPTDLWLNGWVLRDSALEWFTFPSGSVVRAHSWIRVHVGNGIPSGQEWYYGSEKTIFGNPVPGGPYVGDAGYLFDPVGNLRASFLYGCPGACTDYAYGKVRIAAVQASGTADQEYIRITNYSSVNVWLERYYLRHGSLRYTMNLGTYLRPGESMVVHMGKGISSRTNQFLGRTDPGLASPGRFELLSLRNVRISCKAYGGATC